MKLFVAVNGKNKEDCLKKLKKALEEPMVLEENNGYIENLLDFQWSEEEGAIMLADLFSK